MDTKVDKTPRQLAREYFNGQLGFTEYRDLRRRLIDEITRPDATRPAVRDAPPPAPETRNTAATEATAQQPAHKTGAAAWLLPGVGLVLAGLVVGWLVLSGEHGEPPLKDQPPGPPAATTATATPGTSPSLLEQFLAANDWKYDALAALTLSWSELQDRDQQALRQSPAFRVFSDRLRERVLEQQALQNIDKSAVHREQILLSLGQQMGVPGLEPAPAAAPETTRRPVTKQAQVASESVPAVPVSPAARAPAPAPVSAPSSTAGPEPVTGEPKAGVPATAADASGGGGSAAPGKAGGHKPSPAAETAPREDQTIASVPAPGHTGKASAAAATAASAHTATGDACRASLANTRKPVCSDRLKDGSKGPLMIVLPAGRFRMGSAREASEQPVHVVTIAHPFAISAYEVSVAQYRKFCHATRLHCVFPWPGDHDPAANISWKDAQSYVHWLSEDTGATYRLPTEAEWEYAARGRSSAEYPVGDGTTLLPSDARFNASSPMPVDDRSVNVNGFHLRHIVGNLREWVQDAWYGNYQGAPGDDRARNGSGSTARVVRGGSYADDAYQLRASARAGIDPDTRDRKTGLRLVRDVPE
jgi:formylglycine-generating enzyme required for sulfatase activity